MGNVPILQIFKLGVSYKLCSLATIENRFQGVHTHENMITPTIFSSAWTGAVN